MTTCLEKSCSFDLPRVPFVNCCQFMYLVIYVPHRRGGGHIVLGADPVGVGVSVGVSVSVGVTLSCLHDIS